MTTVRANVYESDPLQTYVRHISPDEWTDYYELPEDLVAAFETAEAQLAEARKEVEAHISVNRLSRQTQKGVL